MLSFLGPVGLVLLAIVAALWVSAIVNSVLDRSAAADKNVKVVVRLLPWPRVEMDITCKDIEGEVRGEGRALEPEGGEPSAADPKQ